MVIDMRGSSTRGISMDGGSRFILRMEGITKGSFDGTGSTEQGNMKKMAMSTTASGSKTQNGASASRSNRSNPKRWTGKTVNRYTRGNLQMGPIMELVDCPTVMELTSMETGDQGKSTAVASTTTTQTTAGSTITNAAQKKKLK